MKYNEVKFKRIVGGHLKKCGVASGNLGYKYIQKAIELSIEDESYLDMMTKALYPEVAKSFGTTASRVERAIRHAIETAFNIPYAAEVLYEYFGNAVSPISHKVTNSMFIATLTEETRLELIEEEAKCNEAG